MDKSKTIRFSIFLCLIVFGYLMLKYPGTAEEREASRIKKEAAEVIRKEYSAEKKIFHDFTAQCSQALRGKYGALVEMDGRYDYGYDIYKYDFGTCKILMHELKCSYECTR